MYSELPQPDERRSFAGETWRRATYFQNGLMSVAQPEETCSNVPVVTLNALVSEVYARLAGRAVQRVEVACYDAQRRSLDPRLGTVPVESFLLEHDAEFPGSLEYREPRVRYCGHSEASEVCGRS